MGPRFRVGADSAGIGLSRFPIRPGAGIGVPGAAGRGFPQSRWPGPARASEVGPRSSFIKKQKFSGIQHRRGQPIFFLKHGLSDAAIRPKKLLTQSRSDPYPKLQVAGIRRRAAYGNSESESASRLRWGPGFAGGGLVSEECTPGPGSRTVARTAVATGMRPSHDRAMATAYRP
jgi:hypothetical protein